MKRHNKIKQSWSKALVNIKTNKKKVTKKQRNKQQQNNNKNTHFVPPALMIWQKVYRTYWRLKQRQNTRLPVANSGNRLVHMEWDYNIKIMTGHVMLVHSYMPQVRFEEGGYRLLIELFCSCLDLEHQKLFCDHSQKINQEIPFLEGVI